MGSLQWKACYRNCLGLVRQHRLVLQLELLQTIVMSVARQQRTHIPVAVRSLVLGQCAAQPLLKAGGLMLYCVANSQ